MSEGLRNVQEAAAYLGIPPKTLYAKTAARTVPFTKVGRHIRFTQAHLDAIVEAGEQAVITAPTRLQVVTASATGPRPPAGPRPKPKPKTDLRKKRVSA